jgi:hypothetical protein
MHILYVFLVYIPVTDHSLVPVLPKWFRLKYGQNLGLARTHHSLPVPCYDNKLWLSTSLVTFYEDDMSSSFIKIFICSAFSGDYRLTQDVKTVLIITSLFLEGLNVKNFCHGTSHENREQIL